MGNGPNRSGAGIYAGIAAIAITAGLGLVGGAGADQAANADVYVLNNCFTDDAAAAVCTGADPADVTISTGEIVTFHFVGSPHNAVGSSPVAWRVPDPPPEYAESGSTYTETFTQPGEYTFVCTAHPGMSGKVTVEGAAATQTPTQTPSPTPTPSGGGTTPPPAAGTDTVNPTLRAVRSTPLRRAVRVQFRLSEPATVTVRVKRRGSRKVLKSARLQLRSGTRSVTLRSRRLKQGRYTVEIQARDAYGNVSRVAKERLTL